MTPDRKLEASRKGLNEGSMGSKTQVCYGNAAARNPSASAPRREAAIAASLSGNYSDAVKNPKLETRNPEPKTQNPKPGTRNPKPATLLRGVMV